MSDFSREDYEASIARDRNLQALQLAIAAQQEVRDSVAIRAILDAFKADAERALREFAYADATSLKQMIELQVRVRAFIFAWETLGHIYQAGDIAEEMVRQDVADHE